MLERDIVITGPQIAAARGLLRWSVLDLAQHAGLDVTVIQELESDSEVPYRQRNNLALIQTLLEEAGIKFIDSVGVQFQPPGLEGMVVDGGGPSTNRSLT
jgi:hypothetical protein